MIAQPPLRVYVETDFEAGEWALDPRCRVEEIRLGLGDKPSRATIRVFPGPIDSPSAGVQAGLEGNWTEDPLEPGQVLWALHEGVGDRPGTPFATFISPDQSIMIARDWPEGEGPRPEVEGGYREVLFAGYCDLPRYDQDQSGAGVQEGYTLLVEDAWKRVNLLDQAQVYGRWMRKPAAAIAWQAFADGSPGQINEPYQSPAAAEAIDDLVHVDSIPCVFNPGGRGNCSPAPVEIMIDRGTGPEPMRVYVFTHEADPNAIPWTYARAVRYLAFFHYLRTDATVLADLPWYRHDGPDAPAGVWPAPVGLLASGEREIPSGGKKIIEVTPTSAAAGERPASPPSREDALAFELLGKPTDLAVDKTVLAEALNLLCEAAGLRYSVRSETFEDEGEPTRTPVVRLYLWARGAGRSNTFARLGVSTGMSAQQILDANQVAAMSLQQDYTDVYPDPDIYGDVERYECTLELVPGWRPDENLDDVPDVDAALAYAKEHLDLTVEDGLEDDPWYKRYHKKGSEYQDYREVGRRWVLNEAGTYPAQRLDEAGLPLSPVQRIYARSTAHHAFGVNAYAPWTPQAANIRRAVIDNSGAVRHVAVRGAESDVPDDEGGDFTAEQREAISRPWALRPRPLHDCFSADQDRHTLTVVVEVTADNQIANRDSLSEEALQAALAARKWVRLQGLAIIALSQQAAIFLDCEDLTQIPPWKEDEDVVDAQDETLSLWAAIVEGRLGVRVTAVIEGDHRVRPNLGELVGTTRQFDLAKKFHQNRRDLANSIFGEYPAGEAEFPAGNKPVGNRPAPRSTRDTDDDADLIELQKAAQSLLVTCQASLQPGAVHVPWVTQQWLIGDTVEEIAGAGITFLTAGSDGAERYPDIVAAMIRPGRTSFFLEDTRLLDELEKDPLGPFAAAHVAKDDKRILDS